MKPAPLFDGKRIVFDAMVIINFHGLLMFESLAGWASQEIVIDKTFVRKEAAYSKSGPINLQTYIAEGAIIEAEIRGKEQEELFFNYLNQTIRGTAVHEGEAACLALAITNDYGLASDERIIREEFKSRRPNSLCVNSWEIATIMQKKGYITEDKAKDLKKGLFYI